MATYYETLGLDPSVGSIDVGSPRGGRPVQIAHLVPIAELFTWAGAKESREETRRPSGRSPSGGWETPTRTRSAGC